MDSINEVSNESAFGTANEMLAELRNDDKVCGVLLSYDGKTERFRMISLNSNDFDTVQMLVLAMGALRDLVSAQSEAMLMAKTRGLN